MVYTREQAVQRASREQSNTPDTCQLWTRTMFGAPSVGDRDGDGDADAVDGWKSEPERFRHTDRNPPAGTPVAWGGGSRGYGHRAVSLGKINGVVMVRSTDAPTRGRVGTVPLDWFERNWGLHYLGWSETISGQMIPFAAPKPPPAPVVKTRGEAVDKLINQFQDVKAKPGSERETLLKKAKRQLLKIKQYKK